MSEPAVFLDRDETIIEDPGFVADPDQVSLKPGAARAIRRFREMGFRVVVATNQSGVARGLISEEQLAAVHDRLRSLLRGEGADVDAIYHCPYLDGPEAVVEAYRKNSDLRKPEPGLLFQAARDMELDLARSWMIGDRPSDMEAGRRAGCRTIRIMANRQTQRQNADHTDFGAASLEEAAKIVEENNTTRPGDGPTAADSRSLELLTDIRDLLDRQQRSQIQEDFSFLRLFATLAQMLAVVTAIWALLAMFEAEAIAPAVARFGLAIFLQLLTLTAFIVDRRR
jgi:D-glycero-D-manno-heptose 1,7-bisphosphate phosphatase